MAFKARAPPVFSPGANDFNAFNEWRKEFETYKIVTTFFNEDVNLETQQARLFNIAGPDFAKFVRQTMTIAATTTIDLIMEAIELALKPKRFDLQNREKLFSHKQAQVSARTFLEELRDLFNLSNYANEIAKDLLIRDLFIAGIRSNEARCLIFQQDSQNLTTDQCLHLVSSFESVNRSQQSSSSNFTDISVNTMKASAKHQVWKCYGCGSNTHHSRPNCPAFKANCHKCGKVGHFSKCCKSTAKNVNTIDSDTEEAINTLRIYAVQRPNAKKRKSIAVTINGKSISSILIDSGSDITVLSHNLCEAIGLPYKRVLSSPKVVGANGVPLNLVGRIDNACIETNKNYLVDTVWVAKHLNTDAIMGESSLKSFKSVQINYDGHLPTLQVASAKETLNYAECSPVSCFPTKPDTPIQAPSRRQSPEDKDFIKAEIKNLIQAGKIQTSTSPWRSQAFVVHGNKPRLVIDYAQTVNRFTPLDAYPIPLVSELLDQISKYTFFSYIDLKAAFHQFALKSDECSLTAFEADNRLWEFKCIPFGLRNSPAAFNRALQELLQDLPNLHIYMDDIVIGGKTKEEHDDNLQKFLDRAKLKNITFSKEKSVFGGKTLRFLGHIITAGTIAPDPDRSAPFVNFPIPTTIKQLERFVGLAVYHAKWISGFSKLMDPVFTALNDKEMPLPRPAIEVIHQVKQEIKKAILHVVDPDKELSLTTDASGVAIGAILSQEGRPVAFMSKRLSKAQRIWSAAELEGYAVVEACQQFRHYLGNRPFNIFCDQNGFVQALNPKKGSMKGIKNKKFARWRVELSEFDFTLQHLPGRLNVAADALSRISTISAKNNFELVQMRHEQFGHPGSGRLMKLLQESGESESIANLTATCSDVIKQCRICAEVKPRWTTAAKSHVIHSSKPWQRLSIDFMVGKPVSKDGCSNILTVIDEFTRFPFAFPTKDRSTATIIKCLEILFQLFGAPESIHSDRGPEFLSMEMSAFLSSWGVHQSRTTPYNPTGNSQCERFNGTIWRTVLCLLAEQQLDSCSWPKVLGEALHCIRSLQSSATNKTPHELFLSFNRQLPPVTKNHLIPVGSYAWMRRFVRTKNDPTGDLVQIAAAYPGYAVISRVGKKETDTINWKHLAPHPGPTIITDTSSPATSPTIIPAVQDVPVVNSEALPSLDVSFKDNVTEDNDAVEIAPSPYKTRSGRTVTKPDRF